MQISSSTLYNVELRPFNYRSYTMASELIKHLDDENFTTTVAKGLTLVDFYADWCGPCRMMTPILEDVAKEMKESLLIGKLDIDVSQKTTTNFGVTSIPTIILFKDGREVKRVVGVKDAKALKQMITAEL